VDLWGPTSEAREGVKEEEGKKRKVKGGEEKGKGRGKGKNGVERWWEREGEEMGNKWRGERCLITCSLALAV